MKYLEIFGIDLVRVAVLNNVYNVTETVPLNGVPSLTFSVPENDNRAQELQKRRFVRWDHGEMYRILDIDDADTGSIVRTVTCEGVIATLADDVMFQDHIVDSSSTTAAAIRYILNRQAVRRWQLDTCDFSYRFEYAWSSENLLNALFSIATPFTTPYRFVTDTSSYPWKISLKQINTVTPSFYIFERLNFLSTHKKEESGKLFTRLYGLGTGEGVNQVTIADANNGLLYVDAPQQYIDQYGLISGVYTAREYDSPEKLKAVLDAMILETCEPQVTYEVAAVDLHEVGTGSLLTAEPGDCIRLADGVTTYITQVSRNHDKPGDMTLTISNKAKDLADDLAELADRQRIEMTYSQGATQLWANTTSDNASSSSGHAHPIWIPATAKIINSVHIKIELEKFRTYSKTTSSTSNETKTSSSTSETTQTSSASGKHTYTSAEAAKQSITSSEESSVTSDTGEGVFDNADVASKTAAASGGGAAYTDYASAETPPVASHRHSIKNHYHLVPYHQHTHEFTIGSHSHTVEVKKHSHTVAIDDHTHTVKVPSHSHTVTIPGHKHDIQYGIYTASDTPTRADVYIGSSNTPAFSMEKNWEGDITQYLIDSNSGKIPRGRFLKITIKPDALAKVTVSSAIQAFIQSKTGGKY
ncbi:MAG: phage tail protein [Mogibacterium sp.]|nr:phage tail protein [Mogibacterium sp.]